MKKALKLAVRTKPATKPATKSIGARPKTSSPRSAKTKASVAKAMIRVKKKYRVISKADRQAAFKQEVAILHLSPVEAVDRARLIPVADVKAFRIIRMPG